MNGVGESVLTTLRDRVLVLTINRPDAANALNSEVARLLAYHLARACHDKDVGSVVLAATGNRAFCGGIDIKNPDQLSQEDLARRRMDDIKGCLAAILNLDKPLIAAVNGVASGIGFIFTLIMDRIVASESSAFVLPEINIGMPSHLGHALLSLSAGEVLANQLVMTARKLTAAEALQHGLVEKLTDATKIMNVAIGMARELDAKPKEAFREIKKWTMRRRHEVIVKALEAREQFDRAARSGMLERGRAEFLLT